MENRNLTDVIIEQLDKWNVEHIYGYSGDTILEFFSALSNSPIKLYTSKHEGTAGLMASAEAKLNDELAVCVAHSGPGTANIINGIGDAYSDRVPLLLITGQVPTWNIGTDYKQFVNQLELTKPLTVFSSLVTNPDSIVDLMVKAMTMSIVNGGVSHLAIPMDLWQAETTAVPREYPSHLNKKEIPKEKIINKAVDRINQANKPVILYGRGAKECKKGLKELAQQIDGGLIYTLPAKGIISDNCPLSLGGLGLAGSDIASQLLNEADLIINFGATWWPMDYVPRQPEVIQFDTVKENIGLAHPVELGILGDIKKSITSLLKKLPEKDNQAWRSEISSARKTWLDSLEESVEVAETPLTPQSVIQTISNKTTENEIISLDSGDNVVWFGKYFTDQCQDVLVSGSWRTMGFGVPASLAAKINQPEAPVTSITGDGGISMVLAEILTAVRYDLPVRIIIMNNGTLAMERNRMTTADLIPEEVDLTNPDFVQFAESCNAQGFRPESISELENILEQTQQLNEVAVIDVPTQASTVPGTKLM
ncbi:thiamine pyrophosphate-binding protein [Acetohalobium arabaticum]|uniref:Thiamine pyrophosphate protein TPP binding domain protein n=1 Tax=Acetohalobium arabaticum (strain ATCC 49924 / DSM 5501 / Z-7288) TaxID=574087 RepID=D9QQN8_ACEAZ|nr:thiamine pyrophosphate-binding protein [Acetohalobium arabaticum]ADL12829.1 thiamine pyrophosphate protein TPP binding domain protein [Acetohalobium arabaticum DSM 5501]